VEDIIVKKGAVERCRWDCNGRFECFQVANASRAAEQPELILVQRQDFLKREEQRILARRGHFASLRKVRSCDASVRR
jgi:hypothetical protein